MDSSAELQINSENQEDGGGASTASLLRASRQRLGEELRDVAQVLCIRLLYLEAIEDGDFDALPGNAYALGFIRTYAEFLGLDGEEIVRRFKTERAGVQEKPDLSFPALVPENGIPGAAVIMIGLVVAIAGYGGWYFVSTNERFTTQIVEPLPGPIAGPTQPNGDQNTAAQEAASPSPSGETLAAVAAPVTPPAASVETPIAPSRSEASLTQSPGENTVSTGVETSAAPVSTAPASPIQSTPAGGETASDVVAAEQEEAPDADPDHGARPAPASSTGSPQTTEIATVETVPAAASRARPGANGSNGDAVTSRQPATGAPETPTSATKTPAIATASVAAEPATAGDDTAAAANERTATESPAESNVATPERDVPPADLMASPPPTDEPAPVASEPVPVPVAEPDPRQAAFDDTGPGRVPSGPIVTPAPEPLPTAAAEPGANTPPPSSTEVAALPTQPAASAEIGATDGPSRITVKAKLDSWIQVRDDRVNRLIMTRLLREGDQYEVPNRAGLVLLTGNAGALEFIVDGEQAPAIGPLGAVRRNVSLDAEKLRRGDAVVE